MQISPKNKKENPKELALSLLLIIVLMFSMQFFQQRNGRAGSYNDLFLTARVPHFMVEGKVLGALGKIEDSRLIDIISCESEFDPNASNREYGSIAGMGLGQLTPIAIKDCEKNLKKKIFPFDPESNIECCNFLIETYGTKPWGNEESWWGSYNCWRKHKAKRK